MPVVSSATAQTLYAFRVLRAHGTHDMALHAMFRSVIIAKLLYASSAWSGFIKVAHQQQVDAFLLRSKRCGYCPPDLSSFGELCKNLTSSFSTRSLVTETILYLLCSPHKQLYLRIII
jgi:hypothetical protein